MISFETALVTKASAFLLLKNTTMSPLLVTIELVSSHSTEGLDPLRVRGTSSSMVNLGDPKSPYVVVVSVNRGEGVWLDVPGGYPSFDVEVKSVTPT